MERRTRSATHRRELTRPNIRWPFPFASHVAASAYLATLAAVKGKKTVPSRFSSFFRISFAAEVRSRTGNQSSQRAEKETKTFGCL